MYRPALCCIKRSVRQSSVTAVSPHSLVNQRFNQPSRSFARIAGGSRGRDVDDNVNEEYDENNLSPEDREYLERHADRAVAREFGEEQNENQYDETGPEDENLTDDEIQALHEQHMQQRDQEIESRKNQIPFGDQPIVDDHDVDSGAAAEYQAALREYRYNLKKRPNRKPFNPLPGVPEIDDSHDLPQFTVMDPEVFESLNEDDQMKIRSHQGLIRLRRNEQKLQRLLSIEKPSKRDLLMLLNEYNLVQGKDRKLYEKYIGPKVTLEQLEDDIDYLFSWGELEHNDVPVDFGDEALEALVDAGAEDEDGQGGGGNEMQVSGEQKDNDDADTPKHSSGPDFTSSGLADDEQEWIARRADQIRYLNRTSRQELDLEGELEVQHEEIERLQVLLRRARLATELGADVATTGAGGSSSKKQSTMGKGVSVDALLGLKRASQLREELDNDEIEDLKVKHPDMYADDYEEDDFTTRSQLEVTESELDPLLATESNARSNSEEVEMNDVLISQLKQELYDLLRKDREGFSAAPSKPSQPIKLNAPRPGYRKTQAGRERTRALYRTFKDLDEKSTNWRLKQETVAQARVMFSAAGVELTKEDVDKFMADDEVGVDEAAREEDDHQRESFSRLTTAVVDAEQRIAKQKAWLKSLAAKIGEAEVRSMIKQGELPIDTFKGLAMELTDLARTRAINEGIEAQLYESVVEDQLQRFDEIMAEELAVDPEAIQKAVEGGDIDVDEEMIKEAERLRDLPAVLRPENDPVNDLFAGGAVKAMLQEDLLELHRVAAARGDDLAARKYELMHQRREKYYADVNARKEAEGKEEHNEAKIEEEDDEEKEHIAKRADLRKKGSVLFNEKKDAPVQQVVDSVTARSVFMPKWGELTQEEIEVNRALVKRGDGNNYDFADPELSTSNPFILPTEEGLPLLVNQMGEVVEDRLPYQPVDPTVVARNYSKMSPEEQKAANEKIDEELYDENRGFDEFILAQLPYSVQKKFALQWKKMNEEQRANVIEVGRVKREEFQHWIDMMEEVRSSTGSDIDTLDQYHIEDADPKIYNALEGAFWHVGRWQIDERTPEQREAGLKKKIVQRMAPETPDTQVLLDRIEDQMFGVQEGDETAEFSKDGEEDGDDEIMFTDTAEELELSAGEGGNVFDAANPFEDDPDLDDTQLDALNQIDYDDLTTTLGTGMLSERDVDISPDRNRKLHEVRSMPSRNHRVIALKAAHAKRQASFTDTDPMPTGDQRSFDDYYTQFDEENYLLAERMDPLDIDDYAEPMDDEVVWSDYTKSFEKGQHVLSANTREALWQLHCADPATWTVSALAMKFRISWAHVSGLLHMQASIDRMKAHGVMDEADEHLQTEAEVRADAIEEMKEDIRDIKLRDHLQARGYDAELMQLEEEDIDDSRTISEDMLHMMPRLKRARSPDVRFVTENEMSALIQEERDVEQRFLSEQAKRAARESEFHRENGPIGATTAPRYTRKADPESNYQHPTVLDALNLTAPVNAHLCLTDVTEKRAGRFGMVVRDVTGWLRQPTPLEFAAMRRKELQSKSKFVYTQIPHQDFKTPA